MYSLTSSSPSPVRIMFSTTVATFVQNPCTRAWEGGEGRERGGEGGERGGEGGERGGEGGERGGEGGDEGLKERRDRKRKRVKREETKD